LGVGGNPEPFHDAGEPATRELPIAGGGDGRIVHSRCGKSPPAILFMMMACVLGRFLSFVVGLVQQVNRFFSVSAQFILVHVSRTPR
jgi:hypothetical protein